LRPICSCPSATHSLTKHSVLNGHLSYKATKSWSWWHWSNMVNKFDVYFGFDFNFNHKNRNHG
jgi:hypothetical protein